MTKYVAFLRGINVGGHHKVPMAELRKEMEKAGYENVITLLNSGNVVFDGPERDVPTMEAQLSDTLESQFGFPIPTIIRTYTSLHSLYSQKPFTGEELTKQRRFYITFLSNEIPDDFELPYNSEDGAFRIIAAANKNILSVLDLSISGTPEAMKILQKAFGKNITTRNWNTIERIEKKING